MIANSHDVTYEDIPENIDFLFLNKKKAIFFKRN